MITQKEADALARMVVQLAHCEACAMSFCAALSAIFAPILFIASAEPCPDDPEHVNARVDIGVTPEFAKANGWDTSDMEMAALAVARATKLDS